jgi:hypothetical protein
MPQKHVNDVSRSKNKLLSKLSDSLSLRVFVAKIKILLEFTALQMPESKPLVTNEGLQNFISV